MKTILREIKLISVVGLLLIPIALLGWLFVQQSKKDIAFTQRELIGVAYMRTIMPLFVSPDASTSLRDIEAFQSARKASDQLLGSTFEAQAFEESLVRPEKNLRLRLATGQTLIGHVGDHSNLILDPDLDSYYIMDALLLRMPEIIRLTAGEITSDDLVQLADHYSNLRKAINKAIKNTNEKKLQGNLESMQKGLLKTGYQKTLAFYANANGNTQLAGPAELLAELSQNSVILADQMSLLLNNRLADFQRRFYIALALSAFATLGALVLAFSVLHRLVTKLDDKILHLAHHDTLTNLLNRAAFTTSSNAAIESARNTGKILALHVIDCDSFKQINDTFGHPGGDAVLKQVAECLLENSRRDDIIGRLGGDEFVVLQRNVSSLDDATAFGQRIVSRARRPVAFGSLIIKSSVTIGTALFPKSGGDFEKLMVNADTALYAAKEAGRDRSLCFSGELEAQILERKELENEIAQSVEEDRLFLNFQPLFDNGGKVLKGFEALLRLKSRSGEVIAPNIFIPVAEQLGLIGNIGTWVLRKSTQTAALWPASIGLAVNLSPLEFKAGSISATIADALKQSGLAPQRLQIEITENLLLEDSLKVLEELQNIRKLGVSVAMDDFGTGFSSLSYLWRFKFDKIKIDRSFLSAFDRDPAHAESILRTIVDLGHSLDMTVTAEGVETPQQAELMQKLDCDEIQGFLYGRPIAEQDIPGVILRTISPPANPGSAGAELQKQDIA